MRKFRRYVAVLLVGGLTLALLSGCFARNSGQSTVSEEKIELVYYKLFDDEDVMRPLIQEYEAANPNVTITYRKFTDAEEFEDLIINELAEGEGPDIFSVPHYWPLRHAKKLTPLPEDMATPEQFDATFVSVANDDLVFRDPTTSRTRIFGIPLTVDTLALYYNRAAFEDKIPSRGRPAATWEELKEDVFQLTKQDNSFERFEVAGISLGRSDNIARALDVLLMLMVQYGAELYNENISQAQFASQRTVTSAGLSITPAVEALDLYTSFGLPANKHYSWNTALADAESAEKELETFVRGKVVMIFGYSSLYEQIRAKIQELQNQGESTIELSDVNVATIPQVEDPATSTEKRDAFAQYFVETVGRTSQHPREAWDFLIFLSSKENLQFYNEKTHRPTSRRDMIEEQKQDPIYGVYAEQIGFAESVPIYDYAKYRDIFGGAIDEVLATATPNEALRKAEDAVNELLPAEGLIPPPAEESVN